VQLGILTVASLYRNLKPCNNKNKNLIGLQCLH